MFQQLSGDHRAGGLMCINAMLGGGGVDLANQGAADERAGNRNAALGAYSQAIQAGDLTLAQAADVYARRAGIFGFLGENIKGIEEYSRSIDLNPRRGESYSLRGYLRGVIGQYELAQKDQDTAIELAKNSKWENYLPWVLQHRADLARRQGKFDQALADCEKALQLGQYSTVYFRLAWIYLDMGRNTEAKVNFNKFEQLEKVSNAVFWPDERGAISRLRELH